MGHKGERHPALDSQMTECRELLAEVRGATKDLRQATAEAKRVLAEVLPDAVDELIKVRVVTELDKLAPQTKKAIEVAETEIFKRFDVLMNLLMSGSPTGVPKDPRKINIESTLLRQARERGMDLPGSRRDL